MTRAIGGGLARVTVAAPRRRVDVALPAGVPVAELLTGVLRAAGEELADEGQSHGGWVLRRPDGGLVDQGRLLDAAGVLDGEVLHLVPRHQEWPELDYDDVVEAVAGGARAASRSWSTVDTRRAGLGATAAAVVAALLLLAVSGAELGWTTVGLVALGTAVVCVLLAVGLSRALGDSAAAALLGVLALPAAAFGGLVVTLGDQPLASLQPVQLLTASLVVLVVGLTVHLGVGDRTQYSSGGITAGLLGGLGGVLGLSGTMDAVDAAAVLVAVVLAATPLVPLLSIRLGGLPIPVLPTTAEELLAEETPAPRSRVEARVRRADELLTGMLGGGAVAVACCAAVLVASGRTSAVVLVALVAGISLLRTRLFPALAHRLPLAASGGLALLALVVAGLGIEAQERLVLVVPGLLVLALAALGAGRSWSRRPPSPYLGRVADVLDVVLVLALVPTVCVVTGLYGYVRGLYG